MMDARRADLKQRISELAGPMLTILTPVALVIGLTIWNASQVADVFANDSSQPTIEEIKREIGELSDSIAEFTSEEQSLSRDIIGRVNRLPTAHGVIVKTLRQWEKTERRKRQPMITLRLEGAYSAIVSALLDIEEWSDCVLESLTVEKSEDNDQFVVLTVVAKTSVEDYDI